VNDDAADADADERKRYDVENDYHYYYEMMVEEEEEFDEIHKLSDLKWKKERNWWRR
jgi:hypothetical protein